MHVCGGGGCARGHYFERGLLAGAPHAQAPKPSLIDAQRLQMEVVLAAITFMVFVASVSYIALSTIFSCFYTGRSQQQPDSSEMWSQAQQPVAVVVEETKRALEEIPVVMVPPRTTMSQVNVQCVWWSMWVGRRCACCPRAAMVSTASASTAGCSRVRPPALSVVPSSRHTLRVPTPRSRLYRG